MLVSALIRMWTDRRAAMTAPSIASHKNREDASSSVQTSGALNTKRDTTPASNTTISTTTSRAAKRI